MENENVKAGVQVALLGFRFKPSDEQSINNLSRRMTGASIIPAGLIHEVDDIYKHPPEELDRRYKREESKATYFYSRKYSNEDRADRIVKGFGYWRMTPTDVSILDQVGYVIGFKNRFSFYMGETEDKSQSTKSNWVMEEFTLTPEYSSHPDIMLKDMVLCKIFNELDHDEDDKEEEEDCDYEDYIDEVDD